MDGSLYRKDPTRTPDTLKHFQFEHTDSNTFEDWDRFAEIKRDRSKPIQNCEAFGTLENGFSGVCRYRNVLWRCNLNPEFSSRDIDRQLLEFIEDMKNERRKYQRLRRRYINDGSRSLREEVYLHIHEKSNDDLSSKHGMKHLISELSEADLKTSTATPLRALRVSLSHSRMTTHSYTALHESLLDDDVRFTPTTEEGTPPKYRRQWQTMDEEQKRKSYRKRRRRVVSEPTFSTEESGPLSMQVVFDDDDEDIFTAPPVHTPSQTPSAFDMNHLFAEQPTSDRADSSELSFSIDTIDTVESTTPHLNIYTDIFPPIHDGGVEGIPMKLHSEIIKSMKPAVSEEFEKETTCSPIQMPATLIELGDTDFHPLVSMSSKRENADLHPEHHDDRDKALWLLIMKDVERTLQKRVEFHDLKIKYLLANILFIWAKEHEDIGYQQGMNELVALIIVAISLDCDLANKVDENEDPFLLRNLLRVAYLEHDGYSLFCLLLKKLRGFYEEEGTEQVREGGLLQERYNDTLSKKLFHIHHRVLRNVDLSLYHHLNGCGLTPIMYLFRWVRVLLCREFDVQKSLMIWDEIFLESERDRDFTALDYFCISLILSHREALMKMRDFDILSLLQNNDKEFNFLDVAELCARAKKVKQLFHVGYSIFTPKNIESYLYDVKAQFNSTTEESWPPPKWPTQSSSRANPSIWMRDKRVILPGMEEVPKEVRKNIKWWLYAHYGPHFRPKANGIIREGYLVKRGKKDRGGTSILGSNGFRRRWIVINGSKLAYFKHKKKKTPQREWIDLPGRKVRVESKELFAFSLSGFRDEERTMLFFAHSEKDFYLWIHALILACERVDVLPT